MEETIPAQAVVTTSLARPKRVAFLVDLENTSESEINQIVQYNVGVWGGRYNPIIPIVGSEIAPDWWRLLNIVDPDIIYSLSQIDDLLRWRINRYIAPGRIVEITQRDRERSGDRHLVKAHEINALDTKSIPQHFWTHRTVIREPLFFYIADSLT